MRRPVLLLFLLFALVLASCSKSVLARPGQPALAARVGDTEITRDQLLEETDAVLELSGSNPQLTLPFATTGEGTYSAELLAAILTGQIRRAALAGVVAERGVEVTDTDREQARQGLVQQLGTDTVGQVSPEAGEAILAQLPEEYALEIIEDAARSIALSNVLFERPEVTDEDVQAFYDENAESLALSCASHILVSTETRSVDEAEAVADDLKAQLDAGADFAQLAMENSEDPGSAASGGELPCAPQGSYVEEFDRAVWNQPVGEVGIPVQTEFGFHLILVTERKVSFEDLRDDLRAALEQQAAQELQVQLQAEIDGVVSTFLAEADVEVDARYGTWDPVTTTVVPPEGPVPLPTTTVPGLVDLPPDAIPSDVG